MNPTMSDHDLLHAAAEHLGTDAKALMLRYYGSLGDALLEMDQFNQSGQLQDSFAAMLRSLLDVDGLRAQPVASTAAAQPMIVQP